MNAARLFREREAVRLYELQNQPALYLLRHIAYITHNANVDKDHRLLSHSDLLRLPSDPPPKTPEDTQKDIAALKERARKRGKQV